MGHWEFEHSAETEADPATVWKRYTDVEHWSQWSPKGVEKSSLEGEFEVGSKGMSKAPNLPKGKFELVEVEPERRFVSKAGMPGATLAVEHMVEPAGDGARITHKAILDGPMTAVWKPIVSRMIQRGLPDSVERLAELVVKKEKEDREEEQEAKKLEERLEKADAKFQEEIEKTSSGEGDQGGASVPGTG